MTKLKILVVEDSKSLQEMYAALLSDAVFEKKIAVNGKEGLEAYRSWRPDIILLDMMMPIMTGYQVLKEIRQTHQDRSTSVIIQTTLSGKADVTDCAKLGIQGYIIKAPNLKDINAKILGYYEKMNPDKARAAKEILEKDGNLQAGTTPAPEFSPQEHEYLAEFRSCLSKGPIGDQGRALLKQRAEKLSISESRALELEKICGDTPQ